MSDHDLAAVAHRLLGDAAMLSSFTTVTRTDVVSLLLKAEKLCRPARHIDQPPIDKGAAIVDPQLQ